MILLIAKMISGKVSGTASGSEEFFDQDESFACNDDCTDMIVLIAMMIALS
jgi:hypothetical protein